MLAQQDSNIKQAVTAVHQLSQGERFRLQCEAREDFIRQQIDHDYWYDSEIKKREATINELNATIAKQNDTIAALQASVEKLQASFDALQQQLANK